MSPASVGESVLVASLHAVKLIAWLWGWLTVVMLKKEFQALA